MSDPTQANRAISISTPLGEDVLLLKSFNLHDELCRPFQMELELQSTDDSIDFSSIVGQKVTVTIKLPNYQKRYINGYIAQFRQTGFTEKLTNYRALMVPWVWMLSRASNCRIFQDKTPIEILEQVCSDHGFSAITDSTTGEYPTLAFCVQYDETDLNFVSRLMEKYGIYYFFEQSQTDATMVLCDGMTAHENFPGYSSIPYNSAEPSESLPEHFYDWLIEQEVEPGTFQLSDYNYTTPKADLTASGTKSQTYANGSYERYAYPGGYETAEEGQNLADVRIQDVQARQSIQRGKSDALGLACGYKFSLTSYPRSDQNTEYLTTELDMIVTSADYSTDESGDGSYSCRCRSRELVTSSVFRPACITPKARIRGPQTATVVGAEGKEVDTDSYGNVYVQFHWDQEGENDEESSCLIRVSQHWAGNGWGAVFLPHIGTEVVVSFENGDPDRPLVTGRVYNADQLPNKDPSTNPYLGYIMDSSKENSMVMDATADAEKLTITNAANQIAMDSTSGAEKMTLTDGKSTIVFDPVEGSVTTTTPGDENNSNSGDKSHWTWGKWDEWTGGIKNSVVIGLYIKLYQGCEFGVTTGMKTSIVLGPELKYNMAPTGLVPLPVPFLDCAKFEIYSGNCYKILLGTEYKVETKGLKKLNPTNKLTMGNMLKSIVSTKQTVAAIKDAETSPDKSDTFLKYTKLLGQESSTVAGTSEEKVGGTKSITAVMGVQLAGGASFLDVRPSSIAGVSPGTVNFTGGIINLN